MTEPSSPPQGPLGRVAAATLAAAGVCLVLLALVQAWQVFARYVLDAPPAWTEPLALLFLKFALMLAAAAAVRSETHFRFALGIEAARGVARRLLEAAGRLTAAALGAAVALWGARMLLDNWTVKMPGVPFPSGLYFAPFVVGGALVVVFALERLLVRFERDGGD